MNGLIISALLALLVSAAPAQIFPADPVDSLTTPVVAVESTGPAVWLPPENFREWSSVDALMRAHGKLKLTIGVTPAMASPLVKAALGPWVEQGRIEIAARINGDPVLPLITRHPAAPRPRDALERALEALEHINKQLGIFPTGLIAGAGAVDASMAETLAASGAGWILIGPYTSPDLPWVTVGRTILVPSSAVRLHDESSAADSDFVSRYNDRARSSHSSEVVGDAARVKSEFPIAPSVIEAWPAWNREAAAIPPADPGALAAWQAYGAAAKAVGLYKNSGAANLKTLDAAVALLRRAQDARHYRAAGTSELSPALRSILLAIYKKLKQSAPDAFYGRAASAAPDSSPREQPTGVRALSGSAWVEFRAPLGSITLLPSLSAGTTTLIVDGGAAADPWRLRSLRAEWNNDAVRIILRIGSVTDAVPHPIYEVYTDFNRVLGAGRVPLLDGRGAVVPAKDAWELALSITGDTARLFRASRRGEPQETATFKVQRDAARGEVIVSVPRAYMRGNPALWGWTAVTLAEDPARPGRQPAASLVAPDGTILLSVLAPADLQKPILSRKNSRVPAARLKP